MSEREVVYVQTPAGGGWFVKAVVAVFLVIVGLFIAQFVEITDLAPSTQFVPTAQVIDRHPNVQVVPHAAATQAPFINAFTGDGMPTEAVVVIPQGNPFLPQLAPTVGGQAPAALLQPGARGDGSKGCSIIVKYLPGDSCYRPDAEAGGALTAPAPARPLPTQSGALGDGSSGCSIVVKYLLGNRCYRLVPTPTVLPGQPGYLESLGN